MRFQHVRLAAVRAVLPPRVVTSDEIEARLAPVYTRLKLPEGRLELMSGIRERRFWEPGTRPSQAAAQAGRAALASAGEAWGIDPARIGCLIHASVCRDVLEPATASMVHEALALGEDCAAFDLSNACLGVLSAVVQLAAMIEAGMIEAGLVVSGETAEGLHEATLESILNDPTLTRKSFKPHFASLTIGSGASAVLVCHERLAPRAPALLGGATRTDSSANHLCREETEAPASAAGPLMNTDSEALLHAGCALAGRTWTDARAALGWESRGPDHVFTHQVGAAHRRLLFETLALDPDLDMPTVATLGNTGSTALPTAHALGCAARAPKPGDRIAWLGIGSGLVSLMLGLEWRG